VGTGREAARAQRPLASIDRRSRHMPQCLLDCATGLAAASGTGTESPRTGLRVLSEAGQDGHDSFLQFRGSSAAPLSRGFFRGQWHGQGRTRVDGRART
jgi:hypothetical protein